MPPEHTSPSIDPRLLGIWQLDPTHRQPEYIENTTMEIRADGALIYRYLQDSQFSEIHRTCRADGQFLIICAPDGRSDSKASYAIGSDDSLIIQSETETIRYTRTARGRPR